METNKSLKEEQLDLHRYISRISSLNVKQLFFRSRRKIWSLSDCNWTRIHNHFVHKRKLNHLTKLDKWLSCVWSSYLYGAFDSMFLSFHSGIWLYLLHIQETIECRFTLRHVRDMTRSYSQMHRTDKYSQHSSIIWPVWLMVKCSFIN